MTLLFNWVVICIHDVIELLELELKLDLKAMQKLEVDNVSYWSICPRMLMTMES